MDWKICWTYLRYTTSIMALIWCSTDCKSIYKYGMYKIVALIILEDREYFADLTFELLKKQMKRNWNQLEKLKLDRELEIEKRNLRVFEEKLTCEGLDSWRPWRRAAWERCVREEGNLGKIRASDGFGRSKIQNHTKGFRTIDRFSFFCQTRFTS